MQDRASILLSSLAWLGICGDQEKRTLRLVDKACHRLVKETQSGPYRSKTEFIIGIDRAFYADVFLNTAWRVYSLTIRSGSKHPAMLYKMHDLPSFQKNGVFTDFAQNENPYKEGRIYGPGYFHAWDVNQVWLLAQIHKGRPFAMCSELKPEHIMRRYKPSVYSAFARELATAYKASYNVSSIYGQIIYLSPSLPVEKSAAWNLADLDVTDENVKDAISAITKQIQEKEHEEQMEFATCLGSAAKKLFELIASSDRPGLLLIRREYIAETAEVMRDLFARCRDKRLILSAFVSSFNCTQLVSVDAPVPMLPTVSFEPAQFFTPSKMCGDIISCVSKELRRAVNRALLTPRTLPVQRRQCKQQ